jgi:hypothetical protein
VRQQILPSASTVLKSTNIGLAVRVAADHQAVGCPVALGLVMKTCVGLFLIALVGSLLVNTSSAHAVTTCTFNFPTVVVDGQAQSPNISGCTETASSTGPLGSFAGGFLNLGDGVVRGLVQTKGNATISLSGQVSFDVGIIMPAFNFANPSNGGSNFIQVGNTFFNITSLGFTIFGKAQANVVNQDQALGAFISLSVPGSQFDLFCGSADAVCGGVNENWRFSQFISPSFIGSNRAGIVTVVMAERLQLTSGGNLTNNPSIDASDPFDVSSMELLDANGVPIPGVTFVADDGTIFPDAADTATPIPATLPLFATGLGALGLLGWRRKQKARAGA